MTRYKRQISALELVPSTGGCFEVTAAERLIYSKNRTGSFPDEAALVEEVGRLF